MQGYYSVFNPRDEKIADCGIEKDALTLIGMRNRRWDGHYYKFSPRYDDIIDILGKRLPPNYFEIGGQRIPIQQNLPKNCEEPFIPNFHD